jgi:alpha-glucosidase/alpha-D-xyloside xylohydrolase
MRALWLHHQDDPKAVARADEYLWGRDLLVAPVTEKGAKEKLVYLPPGRWFDFWTEEGLQGGREITRAVDLSTMPLYAKAGTILPLGPVKQFTADKVDAPMTLVVYPGQDGAYTLYEDDGSSFAYRHGGFSTIEFTWNDATRRISMKLRSGMQMQSFTTRNIEVRLAGEKKVRPVHFRGEVVNLTLS